MSRKLPSFFLIKNTGEAIGDFDGLKYPFAKFSSKNLSNASCSNIDMGYVLTFQCVTASGSKSMA
jgi:hypothetical protein